jgi:hypothetical protein
MSRIGIAIVQYEVLFQKIIELAGSCDTILLERKMTRGFIDHWEDVVDNQPDSPFQPLAQLMVNMRKLLSAAQKPLSAAGTWKVENGDLPAAINALKNFFYFLQFL